MGLVDGGVTIERQWRLLRLLPREPRGVTAAEIVSTLAGNGCEVSKRTVERDLQKLSVAFPLTVADSERPYRWSWKRDAPSINLPGLTAAEAVAFQLLQRFVQPLLPPSLLTALRPHFDEASRRSIQGAALGWHEKVRVVPAWQALLPPSVDQAAQASVFEAVAHERRIEVVYVPRGEVELRTYELSPLALVQRGPVLYLVARVGEFHDVLTFVLHRLKSVTILNKTANRSDFDLDAVIGAGFLSPVAGSTIKLVARFERDAAAHLLETPLSADQKARNDGARHMIIEATVRATEQLVWFLRGFGEQVEVIHPNDLFDFNRRTRSECQYEIDPCYLGRPFFT